LIFFTAVIHSLLRPQIGQRKSDITVPNHTNIYRVGHPLAKKILMACKEAITPIKELVFDYSNAPTQISVLKSRIGDSGWMQVSYLTISSFEEEDYFIFANYTDKGLILDADISQHFFSLPATIIGDQLSISVDQEEQFEQIKQKETESVLSFLSISGTEGFDQMYD